ncbi:dihydroneopterin triphosphate 2'-epimerase [Salinispirillum marinum]|uniref:Dihydroneopterin triphosphate 2'-epimerase n=2 Tax=Saccharospirillaceae TaxID=255527 RepID=A0ABV8BFT3_9GAMM
MIQQSDQQAKIQIKNLRLRTYVGIKEEEIKNKQDVVLNLVILFDGTGAWNAEEIEKTLNYRTICKEVINFVEGNRFALLEKMTREVLNLVMSHPEVQYASVEIDKVAALRFADSVSMTLQATR